MTGQTPSPTRMVHYVAHGTPVRDDGTQAYPSVCRAAVVTQVVDLEAETDASTVGLMVINPTGMFFLPEVMQDESGQAPGTWHWPERT